MNRIDYLYTDTTYTFELTIESDYEPDTIDKITDLARITWHEMETVSHTFAEWLAEKLEDFGCTIIEFMDCTDYGEA